MPRVDNEHYRVELLVIVMGGASDYLLGSLSLDDRALQLGEYKGWRPTISFRAFPVDPWAGDGASAEDLLASLPHADGLILTDSLQGGRHYSSIALERLRQALTPLRVSTPTAIFGYEGLAQEWSSLAAKPVAVMEPTKENASRIVKALAAVLLRSRVHTVPPPP